LAGLTDTTIATPAAAHILIYDGSDSWDNKVVSGDITISGAGVVALAADTVAAAEMDDADHGDVAWSSGVATVEAVSGANAVDSDAYVDDSIDNDHINWV
jgi:hypothetical protein